MGGTWSDDDAITFDDDTLEDRIDILVAEVAAAGRSMRVYEPNAGVEAYAREDFDLNDDGYIQRSIKGAMVGLVVMLCLHLAILVCRALFISRGNVWKTNSDQVPPKCVFEISYSGGKWYESICLLAQKYGTHVVLVICIFISSLIIVFCIPDMIDSVEDGKNGLELLERILSFLVTVTHGMDTQSGVMLETIDDAQDVGAFFSCGISSIPPADIEDFQGTVRDLRDSLEPLLEKVAEAREKINDQDDTTLLETVALCAFIVPTTLAVLLVGSFFSPSCSNVVHGFTWYTTSITATALCFPTFAVLGFLTILADFCVDPTASVTRGMGLTDDIQSIVEYYSSGTCDSYDLIGENLHDVDAAIDYLADVLDDVRVGSLGFCSLNAYYSAFSGAVDNVQIGLDISHKLTDCETVEWKIWDLIVSQSVCDHLWGGVSGSWGSLCATTIILYSYLTFLLWARRSEDITVVDMEGTARGEIGTVTTDNSEGELDVSTVRPSAPPAQVEIELIKRI